MALTTLFGTAQLALQDALSAQLDSSGGIPNVPNFVVISLERNRFIDSFGGDSANEMSRFRRDMEDAIKPFLSANGWKVGGTGSFILNVMVRAIPQPCVIEARVADSLYRLSIMDDRGQREVAVRHQHSTIGREHDTHARSFIPIYDGARLMSREHVKLDYADLVLHGQLLGKNPTTLNGAPLGTEPFMLAVGDKIECGMALVEVIGM